MAHRQKFVLFAIFLFILKKTADFFCIIYIIFYRNLAKSAADVVLIDNTVVFSDAQKQLTSIFV